MTKEEIIEMARQAGCIPRRHPKYFEDVQVFATPDVLEAFAKLVAKHERNECLKICDEQASGAYWEGADSCAYLIRKRGQE
jgi:hypothetical protein